MSSENNNQLPALAYLEKVAMSVKGSNPKDAYGCSIILKEQNKKFKKKREKKIAYQTGMLDKINSYDKQEGNNIVKDDEDSNKIKEDNSEMIMSSYLKKMKNLLRNYWRVCSHGRMGYFQKCWLCASFYQ